MTTMQAKYYLAKLAIQIQVNHHKFWVDYTCPFMSNMFKLNSSFDEQMIIIYPQIVTISTTVELFVM